MKSLTKPNYKSNLSKNDAYADIVPTP